MKPDFLSRIFDKFPHFILTLSGFCLFTILCFRFPEYLTTPEIRSNYPIAFFRLLIFWSLILTTAGAFLSLLLTNKTKIAFVSIILIAISLSFN